MLRSSIRPVWTSSPPSTAVCLWAWCQWRFGRRIRRICRPPCPPWGWLSTSLSPSSFSPQPRYKENLNEWLIDCLLAWLFLNKWLIIWLFERTFFGIDVKHFLCRSIKNCLFCFCRDKFTVQMIYSVIFQWYRSSVADSTKLNLDQIRTGKEDFVSGKSRPGSNWKMYKNKII